MLWNISHLVMRRMRFSYWVRFRNGSRHIFAVQNSASSVWHLYR